MDQRQTRPSLVSVCECVKNSFESSSHTAPLANGGNSASEIELILRDEGLLSEDGVVDLEVWAAWVSRRLTGGNSRLIFNGAWSIGESGGSLYYLMVDVDEGRLKRIGTQNNRSKVICINPEPDIPDGWEDRVITFPRLFEVRDRHLACVPEELRAFMPKAAQPVRGKGRGPSKAERVQSYFYRALFEIVGERIKKGDTGKDNRPTANEMAAKLKEKFGDKPIFDRPLDAAYCKFVQRIIKQLLDTDGDSNFKWLYDGCRDFKTMCERYDQSLTEILDRIKPPLAKGISISRNRDMRALDGVSYVGRSRQAS